MTEVQEKNLFTRLKRAMAKEGLILRKCPRNSRWYYELGDYYAAWADTNFIPRDGMHLDLEELAKEWLP